MTTGSRSGAAALEFVGTAPERVTALLDEVAREAGGGRWVERLWRRDASLWSRDAAKQQAIAARLGWLRAPTDFRDMLVELEAFAGTTREAFRGAVLAGMGGSSLAPALLTRTFGAAEGGADGGLTLDVLDSTDPDAVAAVDRAHPAAETLYLIATKSGTTTETLAFLAYFLDRASEELESTEGIVDRIVEMAHPGPEKWVADHFVAITDPGESLERIPFSERFREVFLNPPDVGGRYSALTYVGLVPGALLGIDLEAMLGSAVDMAERCRAPQADQNPGLALGLLMGSVARAGMDKLTLVIDPRIAALGAWIEQLVAESTGKQGTGIVPVDGEALGAPEAYETDRLFVAIRLEDGAREASDDEWSAVEEALTRLAAAGHPVVVIRVPTLAGLGGEFFRWEFATAVAGAVLGVDPFDEPNVTESKRNTERVLRDRPPRDPGVPVGDSALREQLAAHLARVPEHGYAAITAFLAPSTARDDALARLRTVLRDATRRATTVGYGPRYLHSTGQLHKGGPPTGWFLQLIADRPDDLPVPGHGYTFGALIDAQADGDLAALQAHGLPVMRIHLGADPDAGLGALGSALEDALASA
jgi:transaldolase/glucose-6-phosphate isomerase